MFKQSFPRIALLAPPPSVQSGIASYAGAFKSALEAAGATVEMPLAHVSLARLSLDLPKIDWRAFDHIHVELGGGLSQEFSAAQWLTQRVPEVPVSATVHDPERLVWRPAHLASLPPVAAKAATVLLNPWTLRQERQLARRLSRIVTLTQTGADCLRARMRLPIGKISVIPHGNDIIPAADLPATESLKILYFGYIYRGKGIEDLLTAIAEVAARSPDLRPRLRLTLAGGTEPSMAFSRQGSYLDYLQHQIKNLNLSDVVNLVLNVQEKDIPTLIQEHHAVVLPYRESRKLAMLGNIRGTSGVLAWANACGRGVIASNTRALPEEVSYGNGVIFPQGDTYALSTIIEGIASNPDACVSWAESAAKLGAIRAWPAVAMQFLKLFNRPANA